MIAGTALPVHWLGKSSSIWELSQWAVMGPWKWLYLPQVEVLWEQPFPAARRKCFPARVLRRWAGGICLQIGRNVYLRTHFCHKIHINLLSYLSLNLCHIDSYIPSTVCCFDNWHVIDSSDNSCYPVFVLDFLMIFIFSFILPWLISSSLGRPLHIFHVAFACIFLSCDLLSLLFLS